MQLVQYLLTYLFMQTLDKRSADFVMSLDDCLDTPERSQDVIVSLVMTFNIILQASTENASDLVFPSLTLISQDVILKKDLEKDSSVLAAVRVTDESKSSRLATQGVLPSQPETTSRVVCSSTVDPTQELGLATSDQPRLFCLAN